MLENLSTNITLHAKGVTFSSDRERNMANIIVLEDDPDLGALIQASLVDAGHDVRLCVKASETIAAHQDRQADLVLTDILIKENGRVVGEGGIIAISRMRNFKRPNGKPLKFIGMSGSAAELGTDCLLQALVTVGAETVLRKPFAPAKLIQTIDRVLAA